MSWSVYVVDPAKKVAFVAYHKTQDDILKDLEYYTKVRQYLEEEFLDLDLDNITIKSLSLKDLKVLLDCFETVQLLSYISTPLGILEYLYHNKDRLDELTFTEEPPAQVTIVDWST